MTTVDPAGDVRYYSVREAADTLHVTPQRIRYLIKRNSVSVVRKGRRLYIPMMGWDEWCLLYSGQTRPRYDKAALPPKDNFANYMGTVMYNAVPRYYEQSGGLTATLGYVGALRHATPAQTVHDGPMEGGIAASAPTLRELWMAFRQQRIAQGLSLIWE